MKMLSALLALFEGNHQSLVDSLNKGPVMQSFDVALMLTWRSRWANCQLAKDLRCHDHRWSSDVGISRLGHPKMADAFPGKQLRGRISPLIGHKNSPYLDYITCIYEFKWIATIGFHKSEVIFANGRVINLGGMPVSHHREFAMMPVAQFRDACISLGMSPSPHWIPSC